MTFGLISGLVSGLICVLITKRGHPRIVARRPRRVAAESATTRQADWDAGRAHEQVAWYPHRPERRSGVLVCRAGARRGVGFAADELY